MLLNRPRSHSNSPDPARRHDTRRTSLGPDDRKVFNVWALRVAAFYSSLVLALLVAMLVGVHTPAGHDLSASAAMKDVSTELSARAVRSADN